MAFRLLSDDDVRHALPMRRAIEVMRGAFDALHAGEVEMPVRRQLATDDGVTLFMPAYLRGEGVLGEKVVSVYPENAARCEPVVSALVTLHDARTGAPLAVLEGTYLTALRTGAVTGLATDLLARPDARVLTVFGAGAQAPAQIEAVLAVRPIEEVLILSRGASAGALAERLRRADPSRRYAAAPDPERAVREADVIVTATPATEALFDGAWVREVAHVNAIGAYRPDMREVDAALLGRAHVVVDQREAALEEAGDLLIPMRRGEWSVERLYAELGDLTSGAVAPPPGGVTLFKSCGLAVEDVAAAWAVHATCSTSAAIS